MSLHGPVIAIELRLPGASRVGPVGASGSERGRALATHTAYGASQE